MTASCLPGLVASCVCVQGLGSGPKQEVLGRLLAEAGDGACAVFVEDRLLTLDKTMADSALRDKVLPVLAGWGYNTEEQRASAASNGYTVRAHTQPPYLVQDRHSASHVPGNRLTDALCVRRSLPFPALAPCVPCCSYCTQVLGEPAELASVLGGADVERLLSELATRL
eukprot:COSAG06_NODE_1673_length_8747_cov_3.505319_4_plen_169_part_00